MTGRTHHTGPSWLCLAAGLQHATWSSREPGCGIDVDLRPEHMYDSFAAKVQLGEVVCRCASRQESRELLLAQEVTQGALGDLDHRPIYVGSLRRGNPGQLALVPPVGHPDCVDLGDPVANECDHVSNTLELTAEPTARSLVHHRIIDHLPEHVELGDQEQSPRTQRQLSDGLSNRAHPIVRNHVVFEQRPCRDQRLQHAMQFDGRLQRCRKVVRSCAETT